ncbi:MAG: dockerin type I domain-containing protein [Candidatus Zixiibacteriota bacterium]
MNCTDAVGGDINNDGQVDAVDLALAVDFIFFGGAPPYGSSGDMNCEGFVDAVDLALLIDYIFFGGPGPVDPCAQ